MVAILLAVSVVAMLPISEASPATAQVPSSTTQAPTLQITELSVVPVSPSDTDSAQVRVCTNADPGDTSMTIRLRVNDAADGTDHGQWETLGEFESACLGDAEAPTWRTLRYADGPHLVRAEAKTSDQAWEAAATLDSTYVLNHRRPARPRLVSPVDAATIDAVAVHFEWEAATNAESYELRVYEDQTASGTPIVQRSVGGTETSLTADVVTELDEVFWNVTAVNSLGSNRSAIRRFGAAPATTAPTHDNSPSTPWTAFFDDVNVVEGNLTRQVTDLTLPSVGFDTTVARTYNTAAAFLPGPFGYGWSWTYGTRVVEQADSVVVVRDDGRADIYTPVGGSFVPQPGVHDELADRAGGGYVLTTTDQQRYEFSADGRLERIQDANGNALTLAYDAGTPAAITDTAGGEWSIESDAGRITGITDPAGRSSTYAYDTAGDLTSTSDAAGAVTRYGYDDDHRLAAVTDANGHTTRSTRDGEGRVATVTDAGGFTTAFAYESFATRVTDGRGSVRRFLFDLDRRVTGVVDALGQTEQRTWNAGNHLTAVVDRKGGQRTLTFDARGNLTREVDAAGGITTTTFDSGNRPLTIQDAIGRETTRSYDEHGNLLREVRPGGATTTYQYDARGLPTGMTDANGNTTTFEHDARGDRTAVIDAEGNRWTVHYDLAGRPVTETDPDGRETRRAFDAVGRLLSETDGAGGVTRTSYDRVGNPVTVTDPNGNQTRTSYDARNLPVRVTDALGNVYATSFDAAANPVQTTDPLGRVSTLGYDAEDRLIASTNPVGQTTRFAYDANDNRTSRTDPLGHITRWEYDPLNRMVRTVDAAGGDAQYTLDAVGRMTQIRDPNGHVSTTSFDAADHPVSEEDAVGNEVRSTWDPMGNLTRRVDGNDVAATFDYDDANRLTVEHFPEGDVRYARDGAGNVTRRTDTTGVTDYTFDTAGRLASTQGPGGTVTYERDAVGNVVEVVRPDGERVTYHHDARNRVIGVTDPDGFRSSMTFDAAGRQVGATNPNGTRGEFTYDAADRVTQIRWTSTGGRSVTGSQLGYDAAGNVSFTVDGRGVSRYSYDSLDRLTRATYGDGRDVRYGYDAGGNRTSMIDGATPTFYTYNEADQLVSVGEQPVLHDGNGNVASRGGVGYQWDSQNRLLAVREGQTAHRMAYDGADQRVTDTAPGQSATSYLWDEQDPLERVLQESAGGETLNYAYAQQRPLWVETPHDGRYYYHQDQLGSTVAMTDSAGEVAGTRSYDVFGAPDETTGDLPGSFTFAGEQYDEDTGLVYLRARHYDPELGRFLSVDPADPDLTDTQSLNPYVYARNNPLRYTDPSGETVGDPLCPMGGLFCFLRSLILARSPRDVLDAFLGIWVTPYYGPTPWFLQVGQVQASERAARQVGGGGGGGGGGSWGGGSSSRPPPRAGPTAGNVGYYSPVGLPESVQQHFDPSGAYVPAGNPPNRATNDDPHDWFLRIGAAPTLRWSTHGSPDGRSIAASKVLIYREGGDHVEYESEWVTGTSYQPPVIGYGNWAWSVIVVDDRGLVSEPSVRRHFTIASPDVHFTDLSFSPGSPSDAEQVMIRACTEGRGGQGVGMRAFVNTANDGSASGEWRTIKELGVPCFTAENAPVWNTLGFTDGTHLVRVEAKGDHQGWDGAAVAEGIFTLQHRRPNRPEPAGPADSSFVRSREITFEWGATTNADSYRLRVWATDDLDREPILDETVDRSVTSYTHTFDQDHPGLHWRVTAQNDRGTNDSEVWVVGIDRTPPTSAVDALPDVTTGTSFTVHWDSRDERSGVDCTNVQVREGANAAWTDWFSCTPEPASLFRGQIGHTYEFRARARDEAGNFEEFSGDAADASTTVERDTTEVWWDAEWSRRRPLTVLDEADADAPVGFPVRLRLDGSSTPTAFEVFNASQSATKGDDVRIVQDDRVEVDRQVLSFTSSRIDLVFRVPRPLVAGSPDSTSYQLYYGNPTASPPSRTRVLEPMVDGDASRIYDMGEGSGLGLRDASGHQDAQFPGAIGWVMDGPFGPAVQVPAKATEAPGINAGSQSLPSGAFTIEFWMKRTESGLGTIAAQNAPGHARRWNLRITGEGQLEFEAFNPADEDSRAYSRRSLGDPTFFDQFHHFAVTFDGNREVRFYVDGELDVARSLWRAGMATSASPLTIGAEGNDTNRLGAIYGGFALRNGVQIHLPHGSYAAVDRPPLVSAGDEQVLDGPLPPPDPPPPPPDPGPLARTVDAGTGADGALVVTTSMVYDNGATPAQASAGSTTLVVGSAQGYSVDDELLVHQTRGDGHYEFRRVAAVSGSTITLDNPLGAAYAAGAQVLRVPNFASVEIASGGRLTTRSWDGSSGGLLAMRVRDTLHVADGGRIDLTGLGFRGGPGRPPPCSTNDTATQGEGQGGQGATTTSANGIGGGGGQRTNIDGGGAGGGYGTSGEGPRWGGAEGGGRIGNPDLTGGLYLGGGGGGSSCTDGATGGPGGGGLLVTAHEIDVDDHGLIDATGGPGSTAGAGHGSGGGAGGPVLLRGDALALGAERVRAEGGPGGAGAHAGFGGSGGQGRIHVEYTRLEGTTVPAAHEVVLGELPGGGGSSEPPAIEDPDVSFGTGRDGDRVVTAAEDLNSRRASAVGQAGSRNLTIFNGRGGSFSSGQAVLVHQTRGVNAGVWELRRVQSATAGQLTLTEPLSHTYRTEAGASRAQVIGVAEYRDLTVTESGTVRPAAWDGNTGGIVAVMVARHAVVRGAVQADALGFRGGDYAPNHARAESGEGTAGAATRAPDPNGNGGGGAENATGGDAHSGGGGGGNAEAGNAGQWGHGHPGAGGTAAGSPALDRMVFGGGGGGGVCGWDATVCNTGNGGPGGGVVLLAARTLDAPGSVSANGGDGQPGGGQGWAGPAAGGAGAGGSVYLRALTADLYATSVQVGEGYGQTADDNGTIGKGSPGRVRAEVCQPVTGESVPPASVVTGVWCAADPPEGSPGADAGDQFGDGGDGPLTVTGTTVINQVRSPVRGTAGASTVVVDSAQGIDPGDEILLVQTQSGTAGVHEFATVASVEGTTLHLSLPLAHTYQNPGAQAVQVPHHTLVTVRPGGRLVAPAWDGATGGYLVLRASEGVVVEAGGKIDVSGLGFRGSPSRHNDGPAYQGEGATGGGVRRGRPNLTGGGGGGGSSIGAGGGGAGWVRGSVGHQQGGTVPGLGGIGLGDGRMTSALLGGGGGGGHTHISSSTGSSVGGAGGGVALIFGATITVHGAIAADGTMASGEQGESTTVRRVTAGSGGGGGVLVRGTNVDMAGGQITAGGGASRMPSGPEPFAGGAGGAGQVRVEHCGAFAGNPAGVSVAEVGCPSVSISKSASQPAVSVGDDIDYTIRVINTGNVALTGVMVTDPGAHDCTRLSANLAVGATMTLECAHRASSADIGTYVNVATVVTDQTAEVASDQVDVEVSQSPAPSLTVTTSADQASVVPGQEIDYHVLVVNTGNVPLTSVVVAAPSAPACSGPLADIAVGESAVVDCSYLTTGADVGPYPNVVTVDSAQTAPVQSNRLEVTVDPALRVYQTVDRTHVFAGERIRYRLEITNISRIPVTGVRLLDPHAPDCARVVGDIAVGANTVVVECEYVTTDIDVGGYSNRATLTTDQTAPAESNNVTVTVAVAPTRVSGSISESGSGSPVAGAWVAVLDASDFSLDGGAVADDSGNFAADVPAGSYYLYLVDPTGRHRSGFDGAPTRLTVSSGRTVAVESVMAPLRGSVVATVAEAGSGAPLAGVWAVVLSAAPLNTGSTEAVVTGDAAGHVSVPGLRPGGHFVGYVDPTGAHTTRFYPDSRDVPGATPVAVAAGGASAADVLLPAQAPVGHGAVISGFVTEAGTGIPLGSARVIALRASDYAMVRGASVDETGHYSLDVAPGDYKLAVIDAAGVHEMEWFDDEPRTGLADAASVTAPGTADAGLDSSTGHLSGVVNDEGTSAPVAGAWVIAIGSSGIAGGAVTGPDGTYVIGGLVPGSYVVTFVDPVGGRTQEYWDNSQGLEGATSVAVAAGNTTTSNASLGGP